MKWRGLKNATIFKLIFFDRSHIMCDFTSHLRIHLNKQLLQSCVRYRPHNEFCLFYFSCLPSVDWKLSFVPLPRCLLCFCDQPVYRYSHPLAVSVGSRWCHLVPSFLPPPSEKCLCPRHEVAFHPFSSFILLSTQIFNVVAFKSLVSTETGLEIHFAMALIPFNRLRNRANASNSFLFMSDSSSTKLDFRMPQRSICETILRGELWQYKIVVLY